MKRELRCVRDPAMLVAFDRAIERPAGNPTGANQHGPGNVNIVHGSSAPAEERPAGNSVQAGIRRIRKAAEAGDATAAAALARVEAGEQSVHGAMIGLGWRQRTVTLPDEPGAIVPPAATRQPPRRPSRVD